MKKGNASRLFGFVGFKTEQEASEAKKFFNNTFIDTSRISIDFARSQNDPNLARPWSKYSKGSSAFMMKHGKDQPAGKKAKLSEEEKAQ